MYGTTNDLKPCPARGYGEEAGRANVKPYAARTYDNLKESAKTERYPLAIQGQPCYNMRVERETTKQEKRFTMNTVEQSGDYEKLGQNKKDSYAGDGLRAVHERATEQGFDHVASVWYNQTIDFDKARQEIGQQAEQRIDIMAKAINMVPFHDEDTGVVGFESLSGETDGMKFVPTEHGWDQFSTRCNLPTTFAKFYSKKQVLTQTGKVRFNFDKKDAETFYNVIENAHRHLMNFARDAKFRFRVYKPQGNDAYGSMRACLTESYAPIDNDWYLDQLERLIPGGRVSHFNFSNPDTLSFNVLIPDTIRTEDDSDYGGMISAGNCEIGTRRFEQWPSVFRHICVNGCIWDQENGKAIRQVHRGKINLKELQAELEANIHRQIPLLTCGIDLLLATREWDLKASDESKVAIRQILAHIADSNSFSGNQTVELMTAFAKHEGDNRNAFGVINSITRAGQLGTAEHWVKSDRLAGRIMQGGADGWDKILKRASTITEKEIEKLVTRSDMAMAV